MSPEPRPLPTPNPQSMCRTNRGTVGGYFLAGRNMVWWPVREAGLWSGRRPVETAWLTPTSGHPGRGLSLCQQHRQWPLRGPGRDRCGERPGGGWI